MLRMLLRVVAFFAFFVACLANHYHDGDAAFFAASACFMWLLSNREVTP